MSAPTLPSAQLVSDLARTLARLRQARARGDVGEAVICEKRLNWLIDTKLPKGRL